MKKNNSGKNLIQEQERTVIKDSFASTKKEDIYYHVYLDNYEKPSVNEFVYIQILS